MSEKSTPFALHGEEVAVMQIKHSLGQCAICLYLYSRFYLLTDETHTV